MVKYLIDKFIRETILKRNIRAVISDLSEKYDIIVYVAAKEKESHDRPNQRPKVH